MLFEAHARLLDDRGQQRTHDAVRAKHLTRALRVAIRRLEAAQRAVIEKIEQARRRMAERREPRLQLAHIVRKQRRCAKHARKQLAAARTQHLARHAHVRREQKVQVRARRAAGPGRRHTRRPVKRRIGRMRRNRQCVHLRQALEAQLVRRARREKRTCQQPPDVVARVVRDARQRRVVQRKHTQRRLVAHRRRLGQRDDRVDRRQPRAPAKLERAQRHAPRPVVGLLRSRRHRRRDTAHIGDALRGTRKHKAPKVLHERICVPQRAVQRAQQRVGRRRVQHSRKRRRQHAGRRRDRQRKHSPKERSAREPCSVRGRVKR